MKFQAFCFLCFCALSFAVHEQEFGDDEVALLAAYNAGPTNTRAWRVGGRLTARDIPFPETRVFVTRVRRTHRWLRRLRSIKRFFHV
jgi:hypothetical protein